MQAPVRSGELNPFAPPVDAPRVFHAGFGDGQGVWREGDVAVVAIHGGALPARCVRCNAPAAGPRMAKTFYWHHPALLLTLLLSVIVYVVVALIVRKSATLGLAVCDECRTRRLTGIVLGVLGFFGGIAMAIAGGVAGLEVLVGMGLLAMLVLPFVGFFVARLAYPRRIDDHHIWLHCGAPFVASLPPLGGFRG